MDGRPVTIRLLDPPLHEFLPAAGPALDALCEELVAEYHAFGGQHMQATKVLRCRIAGLSETNPMMGLRGCRLGIVHPDITQMQASAIAAASVAVTKRGIKAHPHIMVPLVGFEEELAHQVKLIRGAVERVFEAAGTRVPYSIGTMIEVPRGALRAGDLAKHADFFSFGTNDLTQMTMGFSRDDAGQGGAAAAESRVPALELCKLACCRHGPGA